MIDAEQIRSHLQGRLRRAQRRELLPSAVIPVMAVLRHETCFGVQAVYRSPQLRRHPVRGADRWANAPPAVSREGHLADRERR